MMRLFDFQAVGPTAGDCTTPYDIVFHNECTVREFIDEVLKKGEWGFIRISDGPSIEYKKIRSHMAVLIQTFSILKLIRQQLMADGQEWTTFLIFLPKNKSF